MSGIEWAVIDNGRIIRIETATCPADVMRESHGHGTHGPVGVAWRAPGGEWVALAGAGGALAGAGGASRAGMDSGATGNGSGAQRGADEIEGDA